MGRKKNDRESQREQNSDRSMNADSRNAESRNESLESMNGMETDRAERTMSAGSHGDAQAGDEGVDDPAMSRAHRDDMSTTRMHGDKLGVGNRESMSASEGGQREESQRSNRTEKRANDEKFDNAEDFTGRGAQKEGSGDSAEGTGYTKDRTSNTDDNSAGNPLS